MNTMLILTARGIVLRRLMEVEPAWESFETLSAFPTLLHNPHQPEHFTQSRWIHSVDIHFLSYLMTLLQSSVVQCGWVCAQYNLTCSTDVPSIDFLFLAWHGLPLLLLTIRLKLLMLFCSPWFSSHHSTSCVEIRIISECSEMLTKTFKYYWLID